MSTRAVGPAGLGEQPLLQTERAAASVRRLFTALLAEDAEHAEIDDLIERMDAVSGALESGAEVAARPRLAGEPDDSRRRYLSHAGHLGAFNPVFPVYEFTAVEEDTASGRVNFPILYEGPPGYVHGGVLAVFFDCVAVHQHCLSGVAGKTRTVSIAYHKPVPLMTDLTFAIDRQRTDRGLRSVVTLRSGTDVSETPAGTALCTAEVESVARPISELPAAGGDAR